MTFQNGRELTFNPIYLANPQLFWQLNIYFSFNNKYVRRLIKHSVDPIILKTKTTCYLFCKKLSVATEFFLNLPIHYVKVKKGLHEKNSGVASSLEK